MNDCICNCDKPAARPPDQCRDMHFDGYRLWRLGPQRFIEHLSTTAEQGRSQLACYLNAHTYNLARSDNVYRHILRNADVVYPDGISISAACWVAGGERVGRMTAVDFFDDFCLSCEQRGLKLYIIASGQQVIERACDRLTSKFPQLIISGYHHGYVTGCEAYLNEITADIEKSRPDILLLGMGSPAQERFAWEHRGRLAVPVVWTVGALFEYYAGTERMAPRWLARSGFEWLYRLAQDPRGKWRRYAVGNFTFVLRAGTAAVRQRLGFGR